MFERQAGDRRPPDRDAVRRRLDRGSPHMSATQAATDPTAALRAALATETRIAEALAQRSRGIVDLVESLACRALDDAADIGEARRRLHALARGLRDGLAAGETAEAGDLRRLAESTLVAFDFGPGPRIAIAGPAVVLGADARRLVALALFDLAARSERFGALADPQGRVSLDWSPERGGGLRLVWREFGGLPGVERMRRGAGGPLIELLTERFGGPLRLDVAPGRLDAVLTLPARDVVVLGGPTPRRALVAVADAAVAVSTSASLYVRGVVECVIARDPAEASAALVAGRFDLMLCDAACRETASSPAAPPTIYLHRPGAEPTPAWPGPSLRLPVSASSLAAAMAEALGGAGEKRGR
jgi:two-component sensor histidine kinase